MLLRDCKGKPCNFKACLCGSVYSTFKTSFQPYAFYNKWFQTLFKDQLVQSKALVPFSITLLCSATFYAFKATV